MGYKFKSKEGVNYIVNDERVSEMTREEAVNKLNAADTFSSVKLLNAFEALGLIKFEEEKKSVTTIFGLPLDRVIEVLKENGYCVYKLDK